MVKGSISPQHALSSLMSLKGKVAVVTGGGGWLGTPICEALAELGARLYIASRDPSHHAQVKESILELTGDNHQVESVQLDLSDEQSVKRCFQTVLDQAGAVDVLINNAYSG